MISKKKRRRSIEDTERQRFARQSARHLRDLKRAHETPPADVQLRPVSVPSRLETVAFGSFCTSAADLCAEIA